MDDMGKVFDVKPSFFQQIVAANKSVTEIQGVIRGEISLGKFNAMVGLHVIPKANFSVILGRNFIREFVSEINVEKGTITFKSQEGKKFKADISSVKITPKFPLESKARVGKRTKIPPHSVVEVEVYPTNNILAENLHKNVKN